MIRLTKGYRVEVQVMEVTIARKFYHAAIDAGCVDGGYEEAYAWAEFATYDEAVELSALWNNMLNG